MRAQKIEELLETIFTEREQGRDDPETILSNAFTGHAPDKCVEDFRELARLGLVRFDGVHVQLAPDGEQKARTVVRRHRLAERLLRDLLDLAEGEVESQACEFEHILSSEATDSVCTLLGHPPTCPHGKAIPPGGCCTSSYKTVQPLVTGLVSLPLGTSARIVFVAPRHHDRMDRLAAFGVVPGSEIRLRQKAPSYVLELGETTIALDSEIAGEIYVKRIVDG
jgi:DtxR family transcriptional regulator, Mn-dependent transcriptional regulator